MNRFKTLFVALMCLTCLAAQGQWQWLDKDGRKVFSDLAPPADIPAKNILKQPGNSSRVAPPPAPAPAGASGGAAALAAAPPPATAASDAPKLGGVDKELLEKKKLADAAAAAKTKAEDERVARAKVENCDRARAGKAMMDSGVRVSTPNARGEREVMDDAARAVQVRQLQQQIDVNCR